jgi:hypothetical protein
MQRSNLSQDLGLTVKPHNAHADDCVLTPSDCRAEPVSKGPRVRSVFHARGQPLRRRAESLPLKSTMEWHGPYLSCCAELPMMALHFAEAE